MFKVAVPSKLEVFRTNPVRFPEVFVILHDPTPMGAGLLVYRGETIPLESLVAGWKLGGE